MRIIVLIVRVIICVQMQLTYVNWLQVMGCIVNGLPIIYRNLYTNIAVITYLPRDEWMNDLNPQQICIQFLSAVSIIGNVLILK